jgi:hypothetical protein
MSERQRCVYAQPSSEAYVIDAHGERKIDPNDAPLLCVWADEAPQGITLVGAPIWIQRIATSGAYMNKGDCEKCAAYKPPTFEDVASE